MTAHRWLLAGLVQVAAQKLARLISVCAASALAEPRSRTAVYARVSWADKKADLDRPVMWVTAWATIRPIPGYKVVAEVVSALNERAAARADGELA